MARDGASFTSSTSSTSSPGAFAGAETAMFEPVADLVALGGTVWRGTITDERVGDRARQDDPDLLAQASPISPPAAHDPASAGRQPLPLVGRAVKRGMDVVLSSLILLLALPLLIAAMVAVAVDSRGPVLFRQLRVGLDGRQFWLYKIRTMVADNDDSEHRTYYAALVRGEAAAQDGVFKLRNDRRITQVGRVLRRFSIDELPQLWNVIRGDMSLVGPRPMLPDEAELCDSAAWERHRVRPGITGLWQVSGRCRLGFRDMVTLDVAYWRSWTLLSDIKILLRTPKAVLAGDGAA